MFYIAFIVCIVSNMVIVYAINHMPRHSFWQVIAFDSGLLIAIVSCAYVVYCAWFKRSGANQ
jgi:hypothetical protein